MRGRVIIAADQLESSLARMAAAADGGPGAGDRGSRPGTGRIVRRPAVLVAVIVLLVGAAPAAADEPTVTPGGPDSIDVGSGGGADGGARGGGDGHAPGGGGGGSGRGGRGGDPTAPPPPTILAPELHFLDGRLCVAGGRQVGDPESALAVELEVRYLRLRAEYGPCPHDSAPGGPVPGPASPGNAIAAWADRVQLPAPTVRVQPGRAITGKATYLEIGGPHEGTWHFEAHGWTIVIVGSSTYTVGWGDGTVEQGVTSRGGPWPDGDLRHTYVDAGAVAIEVTQHWTAEWTATGHGGVRRGRIEGLLRTTGTLPHLPVDEVQAVRDR